MRFLHITCIVVLLMFSLNDHSASQERELLGAGATFAYPLYSKMFDVYNKSYDIRVNYQSIGSGGGIRQLINRVVDFGATDAFMTDSELENAGREIIHIPVCLGAVAVTYNLENIQGLKLNSDLLAAIFLGNIKKWNDPAIMAVNPGLNLPDRSIILVHRSDGSGTTNILTDYLSNVSDEWKEKAGTGKSIKWPAGLGAKGNEGVAGLIRQIPGSIGYVELSYTIQNRMPQVEILNSSGNFVKPTLESILLSGKTLLPDDTRVSLVNTSEEFGYPISGYTWIIIYKEQNYNDRTFDRVESLVKLLWWMTHEGQKYTTPLDYAPLPENAVKLVEKILQSVEYDGKRILN